MIYAVHIYILDLRFTYIDYSMFGAFVGGICTGHFAARARRVRRRSPAAAAKPGTFAHLQRWESIEFLQPDRLFFQLSWFSSFYFLQVTSSTTK